MEQSHPQSVNEAAPSPARPGGPRITRRSGLTRVLAMLVATSAVLVVAPTAAQAGTGACSSGDFCIFKDINYNGGRYNWSGNDSTLFNDNFVGTSVTVADNGSSVVNAGTPAVLDDVRAYYFTGYTGPSICFPRGSRYSDLTRYATGRGNTWNDNIESFKWVSSC